MIDFNSIFKDCKSPEDVDAVKNSLLQTMDEQHQQEINSMQQEAIVWNKKFEEVRAQCENLRHRDSEGCKEALNLLQNFANEFRSSFVK